MSAVDRFKGANTNFSERGERLTPCQKEELVDGKIVYHYLGPADYVLKVIKCQWKKARDNTEYYIADFEVVASTNPDVKPGARRNWMQPMTGKAADIANTRVTEFMLAALGMEKSDPVVKQLEKEGKLPQMLAETLDDPTDPVCTNALKGNLLRANYKQEVSKEGKTYIRPSFLLNT